MDFPPCAAVAEKLSSSLAMEEAEAPKSGAVDWTGS